jgi:uncharacterized protein (TIGR02757 family)
VKRGSPRVAADLKKYLDGLYRRYNGFRHIAPDPLQHVYRYDDPADREIAAWIASAFAFGRVKQINSYLERVFQVIANPVEFLARSDRQELLARFHGWIYRFCTGRDLAYLLLGLKRMVEEHGSLGACFHELHLRTYRASSETFLPCICLFVAKMRNYMENRDCFLVADPEKGSALKRLNLFLRWMVRSDSVDPGVWKGLPASRLIIPLDTHMFRISRELGFTDRKQANLSTALEVTKAFRSLCPQDPVRYDFGLTKQGISGMEIPRQLVRAVGPKVA